MTEPIKPLGAGMLFVPELLLREVLLEGMHELAGDRFRLDELFGRADEGLRTGTADEWMDELRSAFLAMLDDEGPGVGVGVGYPQETTHLPYVSIIRESGSEDDGGATMGDVLGQKFEAVGTLTTTTGRLRRHVQRGIDWTTTLQIGSWTTAPELSVVLHAVVMHVLFRHKGRLFDSGAREIRMSDSGFAPDPQLHPRTGYVPVAQVRVTHTMVQSVRTDPVPNQATAAGRFGN